MQMYTTYSVKIKHYNSIFKETVAIYRHAVDYILNACLENWEEISSLEGRDRFAYVEHLIDATKNNPNPAYNFDSKFYKMPSYMRRGAINWQGFIIQKQSCKLGRKAKRQKTFTT